MDSPEDVLAALAEFDRCFASGDAEALSDMFTVDARLLLLHREATEGRAAILSHWTRIFGDYDPGRGRRNHGPSRFMETTPMPSRSTRKPWSIAVADRLSWFGAVSSFFFASTLRRTGV